MTKFIGIINSEGDKIYNIASLTKATFEKKDYDTVFIEFFFESQTHRFCCKAEIYFKFMDFMSFDQTSLFVFKV